MSIKYTIYNLFFIQDLLFSEPHRTCVFFNGVKRFVISILLKHLEKQGYAPKTINSRDGAIRGFFSAVLGTSGMINIGNYANKEVKMRHEFLIVILLEDIAA